MGSTDAKPPRDPAAAPVKRLGATFVLGLAGAACVGLVAGALLETPRMVLRRLLEPKQTVIVKLNGPSPASVRLDQKQLEAFRDLQRTKPEIESTRAPARAPDVASRPGLRLPASPMEQRGRTETIAPPQAARPTPAGAVVQVAAYTDPRMAEELMDRLRREGFHAYLSATRAPGGLHHRVRVRPGAGRDAAATAKLLRTQGHSIWITTE